jgi:hypothetical protein
MKNFTLGQLERLSISSYCINVLYCMSRHTVSYLMEFIYISWIWTMYKRKFAAPLWQSPWKVYIKFLIPGDFSLQDCIKGPSGQIRRLRSGTFSKVTVSSSTAMRSKFKNSELEFNSKPLSKILILSSFFEGRLVRKSFFLLAGVL